jgi:predicted  nucleic acid-binding Zn-ribbon protein
MKRIEIGLIICTAVFIALGLYGCEGGTSTGIDENKPMSEVQAEADKMNAEQLKTIAMEYKKAINAKMAELDKAMMNFRDIPATEKLGKEATETKQNLEALTNSVKALQIRFQVYYDKLNAQGGDVSQLKI